MLGLTLAHWQELTVYDDERTRSLLRQARIDDPGALDVERARELARKANVGTLILGDIRRLNDTLVVEAKLHDVRSGTRVSTEVVRVAASNDPRAAFDSLAARILRVGRVAPGEHPGAVAQTTRSLDAYRLYLEGMDAYTITWWRFAVSMTGLGVFLALRGSLPRLRKRCTLPSGM